jgi:tetratricopeptide (TPR) repeat protein
MAKKAKDKEKSATTHLKIEKTKVSGSTWAWIWGIFALLVSIVISWNAQSPTLDLRWMLIDSIVPILGILFLMGKWISKEDNPVKSPITGAVLGYALIYLISQFAPMNRFTLLEGMRHTLSLILIYLIALQTLRTPGSWKIVFHFLLAGGLLASIYALIQRVGMDPIPWEMGGDVGNISSFLGNSNLFGWYLAALVPIALGMLAAKPASKTEKYWLSAELAFLLIALAVAKNRAGLVAFLASAGLFAVLFLSLKSRFEEKSFYSPATLNVLQKIYAARKQLLGIAFILVLVLGVVFWNHYTKKSDVPIKGRFLHWKTSALIVKEHPFLGLGPGNYGNQYLIYQARVLENPANASFKRISREVNLINAEYAHNEFIQSLCDTGILGFALFSFLVAVILITGYRGWKDINALDISLLVLGCNTGLISLLISGLFGFPFHVPVTGMIFWLLLAALASLINIGLEKKEMPGIFPVPAVSRILSNKSAGIIYLVLLSGYALWAVPAAVNSYRASLWVREGRVWAEKEGNMEEAAKALQQAVTLAPNNGQAHYFLGGYYARLQQNDLALAEYNKALQNYNDVHIFFNIGQIYFTKQQYDKAEEYYKKALFLNDTMYYCYRQLGLVAAIRNQLPLALGYFKKYLEFEKTGPEAERFRVIVVELEKELRAAPAPAPKDGITK